MKKWRRYLALIWRRVRIPVAVMMTLSLCLMCMGRIVFPVIFPDYDYRYSVYMSRTVTPEQGKFRAIYMGESRPEAGFGGGEDFLGMIVLRRINGRGPDTRVFVYKPAYYPDPSDKFYESAIKWLSPNHLQISLDRVDHIYSRKTEARGVRITYRIGKVVHP